MKQHTLKESFSFEGKGLHTGLYIHSTFYPAAPDTGIRIRRVDLPKQPTHEALAEYVSATERSTVVERGKWKVSTLEHAMSALYAMGVDNCLIELDGPEVPILDGSARMFVKEIQRVGLEEQDAEQKVFVVEKPIEYRSEHGNYMLLLPSDKYEVEVTLRYPTGLLQEQRAELNDLNDYAREVSAARTFCFMREIEPLLRLGLIKGGDLKNALVIYETPLSQEGFNLIADKLGQPHMDATKLGYLSPLNYPNEPARHKLLDLIGDMALLGCRIQGRIIATRPGHTFNTQCCRQLRNFVIDN
jgi:UDP-3-O-[3-hydroxymyristoyl] N-acetylglucosamine deacetylase/3-hydroxyacyl-[acyl-carrier-protein] dehydratase